jgi:hypothetical protein
VTSKSLWKALEALKANVNICDVFKGSGIRRSRNTSYNIINRFKVLQYRIREFLSRAVSPPACVGFVLPHLQTIAHIEKAFVDSACPISAFQEYFQVSFL